VVVSWSRVFFRRKARHHAPTFVGLPGIELTFTPPNPFAHPDEAFSPEGFELLTSEPELARKKLPHLMNDNDPDVTVTFGYPRSPCLALRVSEVRVCVK
jgi:hypothetical protein